MTQKTGDLLCYVALCSPHWFARLGDLQKVCVGGLQSHLADTISLFEYDLPDFMHRPAQQRTHCHRHVQSSTLHPETGELFQC